MEFRWLWRNGALALALLAVAVLPAAASRPQAAAADFETVGNVNEDKLFALRANIAIPDGGELSWPLHVPDDVTISSVSVSLRGLYHRTAGDLSIQLYHLSGSSIITERRGGTYKLGLPAANPRALLDAPLTGTGWTYTFEDPTATNLALAGTASQSSTYDSSAAALAIDGNRNPLWAEGSVAMTGGHGSSDGEAWWQVDLGSSQAVGSVLLWARGRGEPRDEVQVVTTNAVTALSGRFSLRFAEGVSEATDFIAFDAVAARHDEDGSTTLGVGEGESMQSKLEALDNVGHVRVTRSGPTAVNGYSWTITFLDNPGDLAELTLESNVLGGDAVSVAISTAIDGNALEDAPLAQLAPLDGVWLMLLAADPGDVSLATAKAAAAYKTRIDTTELQTNLLVPDGSTAQFVRLQREDDDYLALAEVQVFASQEQSFANYIGGSPIASATYMPEQSFTLAFAGLSSKGSWMLRIADAVAQSAQETASRAQRISNGRGALDSWVLTVTDSGATTRTYYSSVTASVDTLPLHGSLYTVSGGARDQEITAVVGRELLLSPCYDSCAAEFDVGTPVEPLEDGDVAVSNVLLAERQLIYAPPTDYKGTDSMRFSVYLGSSSSSATVTLHTRKCRVDCTNDAF
eukprot:PLAT5078.1.p1 GENE.PLAT5078.1~~PLAT5078.1.p1  ORF type:complete len:632 (-),score=203.59 PLAT5078.1:142-2037(-)